VERELPEQQISSRRKHLFRALGAIGIIIAGGWLTVDSNSQEASKVEKAAQTLTAKRNTCTIKSIEQVLALGKPALSVTIDVTPKTRPDSYNERYDGIGMDVTFEDETSNLISGVVVTNKTHGNEPSLGNKPDAAAISAPLLSPDKATYEVFRQNAIAANVTGPFVADAHLFVANLISCGSFTYEPPARLS
jgi:hypothetical protein